MKTIAVLIIAVLISACTTTTTTPKRPCTPEERQMMENVSSKFAVINPSIRAQCK